MADAEPKAAGWQEHALPPMLTRRFEFDSYGATRAFLDRVAELSKREGYYPSINFGKTYVNVSIDADGQPLGEVQYRFARNVTALASPSV